MSATVPSGLQPMVDLMGVPFPHVNTDGMVATSAAHTQTQATTDTGAALTQTSVARTVGPNAPAYAGDSANAMSDHSADTGRLLSQASDSTRHIPNLINGAARITNSAQTQVIAIAAMTAVAAYKSSAFGGPFGQAEALAQIAKGRRQAVLTLEAADEGANITLSQLFRRLVTEPMQKLLARLKLPPGDGLIPVADGPALSIGDTKLTTESLEANKGQRLNMFGKGKRGSDGATNELPQGAEQTSTTDAEASRAIGHEKITFGRDSNPVSSRSLLPSIADAEQRAARLEKLGLDLEADDERWRAEKLREHITDIERRREQN
jgi:hypothetical protein